MTPEERKKITKQIEIDLDDIKYITKNYNFDELSDLEIQELYRFVSNTWLKLSKIV